MLYHRRPETSRRRTRQIHRRGRERDEPHTGEGLRYVSSWVDLELKRCFQLMETEHASLFAVWIQAWSDLVDFEVVPVQASAEAASCAATTNPRDKERKGRQGLQGLKVREFSSLSSLQSFTSLLLSLRKLARIR